MSSPLPGMDPYLEDPKLWPGFQQQFVTCVCHLLLPNLVDRYHPRAGQRTYHTETPLFTSIIREEHSEPYVEVRRRGDGKLVTLIDVVSPMNRTNPVAKAAYLATRRQAQLAGANLVEIDLVLQGTPTLDYPRDGIPECDYTVSVVKAERPDRYDIYTMTLREKLKKIALPLAKDDRAHAIDLHAAFSRCYDQNGYAKSVSYAADPPVPLKDGDKKWLDAWLRQLKLRG